MSITVQCPQCNKGCRVPDDKAGKRMKCKECDAMVPIPASDDEFGDDFGDDEFDDPQLTARRKSDGEGTTKKPKKNSSSFTSPIQLAVGGVIAVAAVGIVFYILNDRGIIGEKSPLTPIQAEISERDTPEAIKQNREHAQAILSIQDDLLATFQSVKDRETAKVAAGQLDSLFDRFQAWHAKTKSLPKVSGTANSELMRDFEEKIALQTKQINAAVTPAVRNSLGEPTFRAARLRFNELKKLGRKF